MLAACSGAVGSTPDEPVGEATSAFDQGDGANDSGKHLFAQALPGTNGRSCTTCHVPEDHFVLTPAHVAALYAEKPNDPLFNPIDSDDPTAATPTYDHLMAGLVRVVLPLADNIDVIDGNGNVITNAERTIWVWRSVPTIENTAYTGPYQYDGRAPTLPIQADGALHAHSQIDHEPSHEVLDHIADFERTVFSGQQAAEVADAIEDGRTPAPLHLDFPPGSDEAAGQALFQNICAACHGTGTVNAFTNQAVRDSFFPVQHADGTIDIAGFLPTGVAIPVNFLQDVQAPHMGTYGIAPIQVLREIGALPNTSGLTFPHYRIRFYTDATRTTLLRDMPPAPPGIGPSLFPEPFTVDPGRSVISGDPYDWEGFKVLQLRGVSKTAPYFHDNSVPDLHAVLDEYSRLIFPTDPALNLPYAYPPEGPGLPPEALSPTQKAQLFAFLQKL